MKGITMEEKQKNKRERKRILQEIVEKHAVYNHLDVQKIFKKEYGLEIAQSSISRYIKELAIGKDPKTAQYVLGKKLHEKEANRLVSILNNADGVLVEGDWESLMLKMKPTYVEAVAEQMEQLFAVENIEIHIFPGFNGSVLIYFDKADAKRVKSFMKQVVDYYQQD